MERITFAVVCLLFLATLTRSTFGFGDALISVPTLAMLLPLNEVRALVACVSITTAVTILARDWREMHFASVWKIILSAGIGIPFGFYFVAKLDERIIKLILACLILCFATYSLLRLRPFTLKTDRSIWGFGLCAGVLCGAYNVPGPPLVIFGALRQWPAEHFRATMQAVALPLGCFLVSAHLAAGTLTMHVLRYYLLAVPFTITAVLLGRRLHYRFRGKNFARCVYVLLLGIGSMLLVQSLRLL